VRFKQTRGRHVSRGCYSDYTIQPLPPGPGCWRVMPGYSSRSLRTQNRCNVTCQYPPCCSSSASHWVRVRDCLAFRRCLLTSIRRSRKASSQTTCCCVPLKRSGVNIQPKGQWAKKRRNASGVERFDACAYALRLTLPAPGMQRFEVCVANIAGPRASTLLLPPAAEWPNNVE
jgi:hypothetical protein